MVEVLAFIVAGVAVFALGIRSGYSRGVMAGIGMANALLSAFVESQTLLSDEDVEELLDG